MGLLGCKFIFTSSMPSTEVVAPIYHAILDAVSKGNSATVTARVLRLSPNGLRVEDVRNVDLSTNFFDRSFEAYALEHAATRPMTTGQPTGQEMRDGAAIFFELTNAHRKGISPWYLPPGNTDEAVRRRRELANSIAQHEEDAVFKASMPAHQDPDSVEVTRALMGPEFESEVLNKPLPTGTERAFPFDNVNAVFQPERIVRHIGCAPGRRPRVYIAYDPAKAGASERCSDAIIMACIVQPMSIHNTEADLSGDNAARGVLYNSLPTALPMHGSIVADALQRAAAQGSFTDNPNRFILQANSAGYQHGTLGGGGGGDDGGRFDNPEPIQLFPNIVVRVIHLHQFCHPFCVRRGKLA